MPEFFSSNGSLLSADNLLVSQLEVVSEEEETEKEARQVEQMAQRPLPAFVLHPKPKSSSERMDLKLNLDQIPPMPYSEQSLPPTPTHHRMALSSLPRLPSLSEHNNDNDVKPPSPTCVLKEQIQHEIVVVIDSNDNKKNTKGPTFQRKSSFVVRKRQSDEGKRNSLVARCA